MPQIMSLKRLVEADPAWRELLPLLCPFKCYRLMLQLLQLCDASGQFHHAHHVPVAPHPFTGARVMDMSLSHRQRLRAVGCGLTARLVRLLLRRLPATATLQPRVTGRFPCRGMLAVARRVASAMAAASLRAVVAESERAVAVGQCGAAALHLRRAVALGHLPSRAHLAWMMLKGRQGIVCDENGAYDLVEPGAALGCSDCQGVLSYCFLLNMPQPGCAQAALAMARRSATSGSRYGQYAVGCVHEFGAFGSAINHGEAVSFYRLAGNSNRFAVM